jgi:hypothetical protein
LPNPRPSSPPTSERRSSAISPPPPCPRSSTSFYIVRRNADLAKAHRVVSECLDSFEILPVDRSTLEHARTLPGSDFEDNLQIACAVIARLDAIVTRDPRGFAGSPVPVYSLAEFLARLSKGEVS